MQKKSFFNRALKEVSRGAWRVTVVREQELDQIYSAEAQRKSRLGRLLWRFYRLRLILHRPEQCKAPRSVTQDAGQEEHHYRYHHHHLTPPLPAHPPRNVSPLHRLPTVLDHPGPHEYQNSRRSPWPSLHRPRGCDGLWLCSEEARKLHPSSKRHPATGSRKRPVSRQPRAWQLCRTAACTKDPRLISCGVRPEAPP
jgi:hypothetical protein